MSLLSLFTNLMHHSRIKLLIYFKNKSYLLQNFERYKCMWEHYSLYKIQGAEFYHERCIRVIHLPQNIPYKHWGLSEFFIRSLVQLQYLANPHFSLFFLFFLSFCWFRDLFLLANPGFVLVAGDLPKAYFGQRFWVQSKADYVS